MIRLIIVEVTNQLAVLPALRHLGAVVECREDAQTRQSSGEHANKCVRASTGAVTAHQQSTHICYPEGMCSTGAVIRAR